MHYFSSISRALCNNNSSDENNMNHSSKVEGLYTRMPTPVEKQSKTASGSASAGLSSSHSIIFRQKKKDSGYGSQGHLKLELVNYVQCYNLAFSNSIQCLRAKANTMKATFCCYHHSSVSLFSFHIEIITEVYLQKDSIISLE